jgi:hypothetical protein
MFREDPGAGSSRDSSVGSKRVCGDVALPDSSDAGAVGTVSLSRVCVAREGNVAVSAWFGDRVVRGAPGRGGDQGGSGGNPGADDCGVAGFSPESALCYVFSCPVAPILI